MYDASPSPRNIIRSLANRIRGLDELPCIKSEMKYHLYKSRDEQTKQAEANTLLAYLSGQKELSRCFSLLKIYKG